jgi:hypothetical protein
MPSPTKYLRVGRGFSGSCASVSIAMLEETCWAATPLGDSNKQFLAKDCDVAP